MRPRTKFQYEVVAANERLQPLTEKQLDWAFRSCVKHYAYRYKNGTTYCLDCGFSWVETNNKTCQCPNCKAHLKIEDTRNRKYESKSYFSVLTTISGIQVQRVYLLDVKCGKGKLAQKHTTEIARYWMNEDGKVAVTALKRSMGYYLDSFVYSSTLELRNDNEVYQHIADSYVYPQYNVIPKLKRNGMKGSLANIPPQKLMIALLKDSRAETLIKNGKKNDLAFFLSRPMDFDFCWTSYKITLRQQYKIVDIQLWADYIRMLSRCGKDIRNAHYVCPADLKAEHDKYVEKIRQIKEKEERLEQRKKAQANEEKFRDLKSKFFGLCFTDGQIVISVLESVDDYYQEGNALHHCVGQCEYYLKPNTLVMSARIQGERIETIELSLETFKVLQSRGICNKNTKYHDRIINLVQENIQLIHQRMAS